MKHGFGFLVTEVMMFVSVMEEERKVRHGYSVEKEEEDSGEKVGALLARGLFGTLFWLLVLQWCRNVVVRS